MIKSVGKGIRIRKSFFWFSMILCLAAAMPSMADTASENAGLARIIPILDSLNPLIHAAEVQAEPKARVKFRYDWLRQDLAKIRAGLVQKIQLPQIEPRIVDPLKGDFVEMGGQTIASTSAIENTEQSEQPTQKGESP